MGKIMWIAGTAGSGKSTFLSRVTCPAADIDALACRLTDEWHIHEVLVDAAIAQGVTVFGGTGNNIDDIWHHLLKSHVLTFMLLTNPLQVKALTCRNNRPGKPAKWDPAKGATDQKRLHDRLKSIANSNENAYMYSVTFEASELEHKSGSGGNWTEFRLAFPMPRSLWWGWDGKIHPDHDKLVRQFIDWLDKHRRSIISIAAGCEGKILKSDKWSEVADDELRELLSTAAALDAESHKKLS